MHRPSPLTTHVTILDADVFGDCHRVLGEQCGYSLRIHRARHIESIRTHRKRIEVANERVLAEGHERLLLIRDKTTITYFPFGPRGSTVSGRQTNVTSLRSTVLVRARSLSFFASSHRDFASHALTGSEAPPDALHNTHAHSA
jgi:hypothetical protein